MTKLQKLREQHDKALAAAKAIRDKAKEEDRDPTEEEFAEADAALAEVKELKAKITAAQRHNALTDDLDAEIAWGAQPQQRISSPPDPSGSPPPPPNPNAGDKTPKWESFGHMLQAVMRASGRSPDLWDPRLVPSAATGLGETIGSEGGFLVQTDFATELLRRTYLNNAILNGGPGYAGVRRIPIGPNSNSVKINAINETSRVDGSRWGGVRAYWIEEAGSKTDSKPDFRQIELSLKKLVGLCYATDELLQDASALGAVVTEAFSEEFSFKIQDSLVNGSGAGMPLGIGNAGCLVNVAKETGQAAKTIVKENIDNMWSRMHPSGLASSVWLINQDCYPQLFGMTQTVGTGGIPVYLPPGGLSDSPYGTLMGRPVVPIEQCQTVGTKGDIYFCDWSSYLFADKGGMQTASSIHVKFAYDETVFRFVYRADGQPIFASPLTPYKGSSTTKTVGPFLSLAVRA